MIRFQGGGGQVQFGALRLEVTLSHTNGDANQAVEIPVWNPLEKSELEV